MEGEQVRSQPLELLELGGGTVAAPQRIDDQQAVFVTECAVHRGAVLDGVVNGTSREGNRLTHD